MNRFLDSRAADLLVVGLHILLIVVLAVVVRLLLHRSVRRLVRSATDGSVPVVLRPLKDRSGTLLEATPLLSERRRQRAETVGSVLRSIASLTVFAIAGAMVLRELGLDLAPVIAGAGIIGVAVGFGAQNLVKDFLTGMFMILEDQYGVGDVVDAGPATGTVESVGLRSTRLRDLEGTVWHIRNGEIVRVGNKSQGWARAVLDVPLAWSTSVPTARQLVQRAADSVWQDDEWSARVLEQPEVWGLESLGADGVVLRVVVKTAPLEQWEVARAVRERIKTEFDEAGIEVGAQKVVRPLPAGSAGSPGSPGSAGSVPPVAP